MAPIITRPCAPSLPQNDVISNDQGRKITAEKVRIPQLFVFFCFFFLAVCSMALEQTKKINEKKKKVTGALNVSSMET